MASFRSADRYKPRQRKPAPRLVLISGDATRTWTVRPWVAGLAGLAVVALSTAYLGATAYLVFRDDLIGAAYSRNANLQQAYEDRIASLRAEIDKIASRQILEQVAFDDKVERLMAAQAALDGRSRLVTDLIDRARATGLIEGEKSAEAAPVPVPRAAPADERAALETGTETGTADPAATGSIVSAYADDEAAAIEERFAALTEISTDPAPAKPSTRAILPPPPRPQQLVDSEGKPDLVAIAAGLSAIDREQTDAVRAIAAAAERRVAAADRIFKRLGVTVTLPDAVVDGDTDAVGGPYIPATSAEALNAALLDANVAFGALVTLKERTAAVPVAQPVPGAQMTSNFGSRTDPFLGSAAFHAGLDFRSPTGTTVRATGAGKVIVAGQNGGYGNMIEIDHGNGLTTRYAHLSKIKVEVGDRVSKGETIGLVGSTGRSTGPHLHYETRINGTAVNPITYLRAGAELDKLLISPNS